MSADIVRIDEYVWDIDPKKRKRLPEFVRLTPSAPRAISPRPFSTEAVQAGLGQAMLNVQLMHDLTEWAKPVDDLGHRLLWQVRNLLEPGKNMDGALAAFQVQQEQRIIDLEIGFDAGGIVLVPMLFVRPGFLSAPRESYNIREPLRGNPFEVLCALATYDFGQHYPALGGEVWRQMIRNLCSCLYTRFYHMAQTSLYMNAWCEQRGKQVTHGYLLSQTRLPYMRNG